MTLGEKRAKHDIGHLALVIDVAAKLVRQLL